MSQARALPEAPDAEKALLGCLLIAPPEIMAMCEEKDVSDASFVTPAYGEFFRTIKGLLEEKKPVDFIGIAESLRARERLEAVGGSAAITELMTFVPTAVNAGSYIAQVRRVTLLRSMWSVCREYQERVFEEQNEPDALVDDFQQAVVKLGQSVTATDTLRHIKEDCMGALHRYEARYKKRGQLDGLSSGFTDLDRMLNGMKGPNTYIIGGRPASGKTSLGMEMASQVSLRNPDHAVGIFTIEMTREQLVDRMVSSHAKVEAEKMRRGFFSEVDMTNMQQAIGKIAGSKIYLDDSSITPAQFRARARRAVVKYKCKLLLVDYVQRFRAGSKAAEDNDTMRVSQAMAAITDMAKELNVPIIVIAQVNRTGDRGRKDHRPSISDLKQSGTLEEDAYMVGLLHRPIYYCKTDEDREKAAEALGISIEELPGYAELNIEKHRNGPVGPVKLKFLGAYTRFEDPSERPLYSNDPNKRQKHGDEEEAA